jgi:hypothetical protein
MQGWSSSLITRNKKTILQYNDHFTHRMGEDKKMIQIVVSCKELLNKLFRMLFADFVNWLNLLGRPFNFNYHSLKCKNTLC